MLLDPRNTWHRPQGQAATQADKRPYFTQVGLICNDEAIQPKLAQVIFVCENRFTQAASAAIQRELPENVGVKMMLKGWKNAHPSLLSRSMCARKTIGV